MLGKSTHLQVIPQQSTQNTANLPLQTCKKTSEHFFYCSTRASALVSAIILSTQVPLQKFPILFIIIILIWSCLTQLVFNHCTFCNYRHTVENLSILPVQSDDAMLILRDTLSSFMLQYWVNMTYIRSNLNSIYVQLMMSSSLFSHMVNFYNNIGWLLLACER